MTLSERLKLLRTKTGLSQKELAEKLHIGYKNYNHFETGRSQPEGATLTTIADFFDVSVDYLLGRDFQGPPRSTGGLWIPVLGRIAAGIPLEAIEDIIDYEEIDHNMASTGVYFGLQIKGDSMEPRFSENDVVIVRQQACINTGDIAVVLVDGFDATIKKIKNGPEGIMLIPTNPSYEPVFYSNEQIAALPVTIVGKVVELRAKF